ncbi:MAG TPA: radical SAM protein [Chlorobaculum parvum]|uniref:Radical SAM protein n=1 Tax=Chlorobaculum parvum TaxID=274539 RepID=A0A7C5HIQ4_9CHLB|nr:radical SAM protein [Chlorobaculum parvum]
MKNLNPWEYTELDYPGQLAYLTVSCTTRCNFKCPYCSKKEYAITDLDFGLLKTVLEESLLLGLRKVELTGGEALLYPHFWDVVALLCENDVVVQLVTNGSLIDRKLAERLADAQINVAISLSTLDEEEFSRLSGGRGELSAMVETLEHLKAAGYRADDYPMAAIHSLGSRENFHALDDLQRFTQQKGCGFVLNRPIPVGGLQADNVPCPADLKRFLERESGDRSALIPFSANTPCNRLKVGCYIGSDARVRPCSAIDIEVGDLREQSITEIWKESELLEQCRTIDQHLEGSCGTCPERTRCYGCRAVAYATWGSLTAPDPGCFRFSEDAQFNAQQGGGK